MYETHFGLRPRPFGDRPGGASDVELPSREVVRRRLRYGLDRGEGPALLVGPPGTGKTVLARSLAADVGGRTVHVTFPALPAGDLVAFLAEEFAGPPPSAAPAGWNGAIRRLQVGLAAAIARGDRPFLIVDEAHLIEDPATFEALRLVLNFTSQGPPDLALLLVGGAEVVANLPASLADRLVARSSLAPLTLTESSTYVLERLRIAGATRPLFDPPALVALHGAAEGSPRRLNRLADMALLIAYAEGRGAAGAADVLAAASESSLDLLAA